MSLATFFVHPPLPCTGLRVAGRLYKYFLHSSSQFKEGGCWCLAEDTSLGLTVAKMHKALGDFSASKFSNPATLIARMGQAASTTIEGAHLQRISHPTYDVKIRNGNGG